MGNNSGGARHPYERADRGRAPGGAGAEVSPGGWDAERLGIQEGELKPKVLVPN